MPTSTSNVTLASIDAEITRITERMARDQTLITELEATKRVMTRMGGGKSSASKTAAAPPTPGPTRRRGRPARATTASKATKVAKADFKLGEACCAIVAKYPNGCSRAQITAALKSDYGQTYRPNHVGIALQREKRGGRLQDLGGNWYTPEAARIAA